MPRTQGKRTVLAGDSDVTDADHAMADAWLDSDVTQATHPVEVVTSPGTARVRTPKPRTAKSDVTQVRTPAERMRAYRERNLHRTRCTCPCGHTHWRDATAYNYDSPVIEGYDD